MMFGKSKTKDESEVKLGERYKDKVTGFEGIATARYEFLHGCTRINLEGEAQDGEAKSEAFDAPRLVEVDSGDEITSKKTGGVRPGPSPKGPK